MLSGRARGVAYNIAVICIVLCLRSLLSRDKYIRDCINEDYQGLLFLIVLLSRIVPDFQELSYWLNRPWVLWLSNRYHYDRDNASGLHRHRSYTSIVTRQKGLIAYNIIAYAIQALTRIVVLYTCMYSVLMDTKYLYVAESISTNPRAVRGNVHVVIMISTDTRFTIVR